jgi:hypothetical protein
MVRRKDMDWNERWLMISCWVFIGFGCLGLIRCALGMEAS